MSAQHTVNVKLNIHAFEHDPLHLTVTVCADAPSEVLALVDPSTGHVCDVGWVASNMGMHPRSLASYLYALASDALAAREVE